jgi:hypothetical protein
MGAGSLAGPPTKGMTMTADEMRRTAADLLAHLDGERADAARRPFDDEPARRWIEYRPRPRPGISLADLDPAGRKVAHRLLATALGTHAFAQAAAVMALEEVLDRQEGGHRDRHSDDYYAVVFGDPSAGDHWAWRFEGHHVSVSMTLVGDAVSPGPVFLGANPARVTYAGRPVLRPLAPEEDVARALLDAMSTDARGRAVIATTAPDDIISYTHPRAPEELDPLGVPAGQLGPTARALLDHLVALYLDRLVPDLAAAEAARLHGAELHFAWAGPEHPGGGHYYRIQGPDLLIEYDNTQNGANHAHTVLRRPASDFGDDILARHRATAPH